MINSSTNQSLTKQQKKKLTPTVHKISLPNTFSQM